jgi:muramoyltetrapeptide carboxypeptidase
MLHPPYLQAGDTVALLAPARKISREEIAPAVSVLESWGLRVVIGDTVGATHHQYAGDDRHRGKDLQRFLDDPQVKAIIACRGGYGTVRLIDQLRFDRFMDKPKWIVGYSDLTMLHVHLNCVIGCESMHATMPINFPTNTTEAIQSLQDALFGRKLTYTIPAHPLNIPGTMQGWVLGGNLSLIYSLLGTRTMLLHSGAILFLEDLDEYLYHIDRMMMALKRAGKLQGLAGILVGGMTDMKDNAVPYGQTAEEIILEHTAGLGYPVVFGFPAGHINDNRAIRLGVEAKVVVELETVRFEQGA